MRHDLYHAGRRELTLENAQLVCLLIEPTLEASRISDLGCSRDAVGEPGSAGALFRISASEPVQRMFFCHRICLRASLQNRRLKFGDTVKARPLDRPRQDLLEPIRFLTESRCLRCREDSLPEAYCFLASETARKVGYGTNADRSPQNIRDY